MEPISELSKSRLFLITDGTLVMGGEDNNLRQLDRLPDSVVDEKYRILGLLGKGGMGAVYRARHLLLDKEVALKTFSSANLSDESRLRFQREAQAIAKLAHKNVIQVFDFGLFEDGVPYYTMEYLVGESLAERIRKNGPLASDQAIEFFIPICAGLALAHSKGIIHRDLKPSNLFIAESRSAKVNTETVKIVDFGIACLTNQSIDSQKLTTHGTVFGSPLYMSPEQSMGEAISEAADIYSLGCALFEALVGAPPFYAANALQTIMLHQNARPPTLKEASGGRDYPPALEQIVATMLAKSPGDRQASVALVATELARLEPGPKIIASQAPDPKYPGPNANDTDRYTSDFAASMQNQETATGPPERTPVWARFLAPAILMMGLGTLIYLAMAIQMQTGNGTDHHKSVGISTGKTEGALGGIPTSSQMSLTPTPGLACNTVRLSGKDYVVFTFPQDFDPGHFWTLFPMDSLVSKAGRVIWTADTPASFRPSDAFLQHPANFDLFIPNKLYLISLKRGSQHHIDKEVMLHISRLTKLFVLDLDNADITEGEQTKIMQSLPELTDIGVSDSNIQGAALAQIPRLKQLENISFSRGRGVHDLLVALKGSQSLRRLFLDEDDLTRADFQIIGTFANLESLQVEASGMKNADLISLVPLKKLTKLDAFDCPITGEALGPLITMGKSGLRHLELSGVGWSEAEKKSIHKAIGDTHFKRDPLKDLGVDATKNADLHFLDNSH